MKKIIIKYGAKEIEAEPFIKIEELFKDEENLSYMDNPTVGVLSDGVLRGLDERIETSCTIERVPLFSSLGKRIYRKTLCFLLFYASSIIYPSRKMKIEHSLGDGFYFHYLDSDSFSIEMLKEKMMEIVRNKERIDVVRLSHLDAVRILKENSCDDTVDLISTMNDESYRFIKAGSSYQLYTEKVLPSFSFISLFDLREYSGGMLLRYPQMRSPERIREFTDNPLLFSIFSESRRNRKLINFRSIADLNKAILDSSISDKILLLESQMRRKIAAIADDIGRRKTVRIVFISGPSSSGKTTFSLRLSNELRLLGYNPIKISLDDYYKSRADVPRTADGDYDFECLEALRLDLFQSQLGDLIAGRPVNLPSFSFTSQKTTFSETPFKMEENTVLVIEGIHGLNPRLYPDLDPSCFYKVYISALTGLNLDHANRISTTDNRILRRMVRDYRTRGTSAERTLEMWPVVEEGEKNHIFPFQNNADMMINSALGYELAVLSPYAVPLLRSVSEDKKEAYAVSRRLLEFLSYIYPLDSRLVPQDSIIREFIGGSIFPVT